MCFIYRVIARLKLNQQTLEFHAKNIKVTRNTTEEEK